jgi:hypothetical protein
MEKSADGRYFMGQRDLWKAVQKETAISASD